VDKIFNLQGADGAAWKAVSSFISKIIIPTSKIAKLDCYQDKYDNYQL